MNNDRIGRRAKVKLILGELLRAVLPALVFGILSSVLMGPVSRTSNISSMLTSVYGAHIDELEQVGLLFSLFFFAPPLLQLALLGDMIPREAKEEVYVLSRSKGRLLWYFKKLAGAILLSLLMSLVMLLSLLVYAVSGGARADGMLLQAIAELMATWGLCMCAFVVFSNVIGLFIKPLYLLFITMFAYALGLVLMLTKQPAADLFPTVQGMLYAHSSAFGRLSEGYFTPAFSAGYLIVMTAALTALGAAKIRKSDIL